MSAPKEDYVEVEGTILEILPGGKFRVELNLETPKSESGSAPADDEKPQIIAVVAGKMRRNRIKPVIGDRVRAELSLYDMTQGRIVYRMKDNENAPPPPGARHSKVQRRGSRGFRTN